MQQEKLIFFKDANSNNEVLILLPPNATSLKDDIVVETLVVEAMKPYYKVQAKVEIQESRKVVKNPYNKMRNKG